MTITALLAMAAEQGIGLRVHCSRLQILDPKRSSTDELRRALTDHRDKLVVFLEGKESRRRAGVKFRTYDLAGDTIVIADDEDGVRQAMEAHPDKSIYREGEWRDLVDRASSEATLRAVHRVKKRFHGFIEPPSAQGGQREFWPQSVPPRAPVRRPAPLPFSNPNRVTLWGYLLELIEENGGLPIEADGQPNSEILSRMATRAVHTENVVRQGVQFLRRERLLYIVRGNHGGSLRLSRVVLVRRLRERLGTERDETNYFRTRRLLARTAAWIDEVLSEVESHGRGDGLS